MDTYLTTLYTDDHGRKDAFIPKLDTVLSKVPNENFRTARHS